MFTAAGIAPTYSQSRIRSAPPIFRRSENLWKQGKLSHLVGIFSRKLAVVGWQLAGSSDQATEWREARGEWREKKRRRLELEFELEGTGGHRRAATKLVTRRTSPPPPRALLTRRRGRSLQRVISLDKKRAAGAVLLELLAERHRLREALEVLDRQHGEAIRAPWKRLNVFDNEEKPGLYDAWLEYQGLSTSLRAVESEIAGIRHGDFSFA